MSAPSSPPEGALTAEELERFCEFLYRRTGMTFGEAKRYYIDRRVNDRMEVLGVASFADYFATLRSESKELEAVVNAFTVNETYFYREAHQLRCLSRSLLPEVVRGRSAGDRVRIWSAPCSTGEEPYSIAIWLLENWPLVDAYNIEIVGSDIDTQALAEAVNGVYGERALSRMPPELADSYFEAAGTDRRLIRDLRESVTFTEANLIERSSVSAQGLFDVVFCRNVLIYFDDAARRMAAEHLYSSLRPGGFLCLGHAESMSRIDDRFQARRFEDAVVYQRPGGAA
ncbi:protein-glutamate O-methyltransferase CheR [Phenylobacterium sp.]|uniref:CheR family methyltransferase n=1 Tax=Phenylobacterium sp. TaxID=1871053 RepID=UPI002733C089|nr:protein-glutamate O-methyltransferase CheR [Phenylobacterium sp.]MDP3660352.1 protein-glutamate O-methyltransferase CheR [Phenylobacterium sp.]